MHIRLNGERHPLPTPLSVRAFLEELNLDRDRVAVEVNRRILKRSEFDTVTVEDGDEVEVVTFVGGG